MSEPSPIEPHQDVLREATFQRKVISYWLLRGSILCVVTIVGIPFLPIWLVLGTLFCGKYLDSMGCTLTRRSLIIRRGMLNKTETNIPLEKITDLATFEGPIMRHMGLKGIKVETAGGSAGAAGALVQLIGIDGFDAFRDAVLAQRDRLNDGAERAGSPLPTASAAAAGSDSAESTAVLTEIRDSLARIERHLTSNEG